MLFFESELKTKFLADAKEPLASTQNTFLDLDKNHYAQVLVDTIFRFPYNLKGTSRLVGFGVIAESLLQEIIYQKVHATSDSEKPMHALNPAGQRVLVTYKEPCSEFSLASQETFIKSSRSENVKHTFAVETSDITKLQKVVVKPPTKEILDKGGVMGTTILSDGKPSLINDFLSLYNKRMKKEISQERKRAS